jgi:hypothetical protein
MGKMLEGSAVSSFVREIKENPSIIIRTIIKESQEIFKKDCSDFE